jgi:hypothetical protein
MWSKLRDDARRRTSADWTAIAVGCASLVAGLLVLAVGHGTIASVVGACLIGVCALAMVSLLFLLVGESEERDSTEAARTTTDYPT